jgi:integrase
MPERSKGARLYLQPATKKEPAVWVIRDGKFKQRTGYRKNETTKAERALAEYLASKYQSPRLRRDPSEVKVAEVIALYADEVVPNHARPKESAARLSRVLEFFGNETLDAVTRGACIKYAQRRSSMAISRRELSELGAAIRYHFHENRCTALVPVVLPGKKAPPRSRWLTKKEAASLLRVCWRHREGRRSLRHVARFILIGLYTGTRAGAICNASLAPRQGSGWLDLDSGYFYRLPKGVLETKKRQPTIRIPPRLLAHLRRWRRRRICRRYVIEWNGVPVGRINAGFRTGCELAGLGEDVVPHTLRHTCATWLSQKGVSADQICSFLGMSKDMYDRVYRHHHPDYQDDAVNAFNKDRSRRGYAEQRAI